MYCISANVMSYLLNEIYGRLEVKTKVDKFPLDAFTFVFFLFNDEHGVVEQLLQFLIGVVDAQLLERIHLFQHHQQTQQSHHHHRHHHVRFLTS